jgi:hypothetical protein
MKKIPKTIQVDAYTDDDGKPVCSFMCEKLTWDGNKCKFSLYNNPGPDCPIWQKDNTGAEDANLCTWWRCAGLDKDPDVEGDQP